MDTADICNQLHPQIIGSKYAYHLSGMQNSIQEMQKGNGQEETEIEKYKRIENSGG